MKKNNKTIKYLLVIILFLLFLIPYNNYLIYKDINVKSLFSKPYILDKDKCEVITYSNNYIDVHATTLNTDKTL